MFAPRAATSVVSFASDPGRSCNRVNRTSRRPANVSRRRAISARSPGSTLPPDTTTAAAPSPRPPTRPPLSAAPPTPPAPPTTAPPQRLAGLAKQLAPGAPLPSGPRGVVARTDEAQPRRAAAPARGGERLGDRRADEPGIGSARDRGLHLGDRCGLGHEQLAASA